MLQVPLGCRLYMSMLLNKDMLISFTSKHAIIQMLRPRPHILPCDPQQGASASSSEVALTVTSCASSSGNKPSSSRSSNRGKIKTEQSSNHSSCKFCCLCLFYNRMFDFFIKFTARLSRGNPGGTSSAQQVRQLEQDLQDLEPGK